MRNERTTAGLGKVEGIVGMRRVSGRSGLRRRVGLGRSAFVALLISLAVVASGILAAGQSLTVTSVTGIFTNTKLTNGNAASGDGTASIRWGTATQGSRSGYDFVAAAVSALGPGAPVVIGTFTHQNWPISGETLKTGTLKVTIAFSDQRITDPSIDITIPLTHDETPNQANPCAYPSGPNQNGCADAVTIGTVTSEPIVIGGVLCTVSVWFGNGSTQFLTAEQAANSISLYLQFSCPSFNPKLAIVKTGPASSTIGASVTYNFSVSHSALSDGSPVGSVAVSDSIAGAATLVSKSGGDQDPYLEAGETWNYTATRTVSPSDPSPLVNTGCVTGLDIDSDTITACGTHSMTIPQSPGIGLVKTASNGPYAVGSIITYSFLVTNTGNVTLHGLSITDPLAGLSAITGYATTLAPGASTTGTASYVVTQADVDRGSIYNLATATGISPSAVSVTATDDATVVISQNPLIALAKAGTLNMTVVAPTDRADVGDKITYAFTVTNTGNVTLTNVTITDPKVTVVGGPIASLAPGASNNTTFTATYTLTQADINTGSVYNLATATGTKPGGGTATGTGNTTVALPQTPALAVSKTGDLGPVTIGGSVNYTIVVSNVGNITLHDVVVSDARLAWGDTIGTLAVGASKTYNLTYGLVTELDLPGPIANTAVADSAETAPVSASHSIAIVTNPAIAVVKDANKTSVTTAGEKITYTFTVTNPGNVTLSGVTLTDTKTDAAPTYVGGDTNANGKLDLSETWTYSGIHTVTQAELDLGTAIVNIATADSTESLPATATKTVYVTQGPAIAVVKDANKTSVTTAGEKITYTFTVTNPGNVTLSGVTLVDTKTDAAPTYVGGDTNANSKLDLSETWTYSGIHTVTQAELDAGAPIVNVATADSTESLPATATKTVYVTQGPAIAV
ncbi:MAG: THxN family PEP-CTERM protein, partial [Candidatus Bipolaricaulota bacterium]|nr:THxN family PEP-CTERM protein [Candidatus Bipolaricaulota bacterium]